MLARTAERFALLDMFSQCSDMEPDSARLADILIRSPVWARLALTAANPGLVERAAETMACLNQSQEEAADPQAAFCTHSVRS